MTKINIKKSNAITIIATLVVGLVLLSPITILPNISAQTSSQIPSYALKLQQNISEQIKTILIG